VRGRSQFFYTFKFGGAAEGVFMSRGIKDIRGFGRYATFFSSSQEKAESEARVKDLTTESRPGTPNFNFVHRTIAIVTTREGRFRGGAS